MNAVQNHVHNVLRSSRFGIAILMIKSIMVSGHLVQDVLDTFTGVHNNRGLFQMRIIKMCDGWNGRDTCKVIKNKRKKLRQRGLLA